MLTIYEDEDCTNDLANDSTDDNRLDGSNTEPKE